MAIIHGVKPQAEPFSARVRVVVKLTERVMQRRAGDEPRLSIASAVSDIQRVLPDARFTPYFDEATDLRRAASAPFDRYIAAEVGDRETANALVRRLQALDVVEEAYVEGGPVPPPVVNAGDDPRSGDQGYLAAAPGGINARWAWDYANGSGIGFVDLERGWTLNHQDLAAANITVISGLNQDFPGHGTSVLGEIVAVDNALGGVGIAPRANMPRGVGSGGPRLITIPRQPSCRRAGDEPRRRIAAQSADELRQPFRGAGRGRDGGVDAIRAMTDDGIVVVEAAGNGGHDLDTFTNTAGEQVLNRQSDDFRDSGAIWSDAASSTHPHTRLVFSCHGSRIDCFAWGRM